jgi:hypothetical protein
MRFEQEIDALRQVEEEEENQQRALKEVEEEEEKLSRELEAVEKENPELFCPCPSCPAALQCIAHFKKTVPRNSNDKKSYFKEWIRKCVCATEVKSRQDLLYLVDEWTGYDTSGLHVEWSNKNSYRVTVGKCLKEIVEEAGPEPEQKVFLIETKNGYFYSSKPTKTLSVAAQDYIMTRLLRTIHLKKLTNDIGNCLTNIVKVYFEKLGETARTNVPIDPDNPTQKTDIDVLTKEFMIEVRNYFEPLDSGALPAVFRKMKAWEDKGFDKQRVLICSDLIGKRMQEKCEKRKTILIAIGHQILPNDIYEEYKTGDFRCISDNPGTRFIVWNKLLRALHPNRKIDFSPSRT